MSEEADDSSSFLEGWESYPNSSSDNIAPQQLTGGLAHSGLGVVYVHGVPRLPVATPLRSLQLAAKRIVDIVGAALLLFILAPLLLAISALVKLTSTGPVFFLQERVGLDGRTFNIIKFRTMFTDRCDTSGVAQTVVGDARVTPLGRLMRQRSLDELPQLINVIIGNMSLVGPRPHVTGQLAAGEPCEAVIPHYAFRHLAKPGITGWAQVNGHRGPTDTIAKARLRVDHDQAYIQNFSLLLDLRILLLTLQREFLTGSGS